MHNTSDLLPKVPQHLVKSQERYNLVIGNRHSFVPMGKVEKEK